MAYRRCLCVFAITINPKPIHLLHYTHLLSESIHIFFRVEDPCPSLLNNLYGVLYFMQWIGSHLNTMLLCLKSKTGYSVIFSLPERQVQIVSQKKLQKLPCWCTERIIGTQIILKTGRPLTISFTYGETWKFGYSLTVVIRKKGVLCGHQRVQDIDKNLPWMTRRVKLKFEETAIDSVFFKGKGSQQAEESM